MIDHVTCPVFDFHDGHGWRMWTESTPERNTPTVPVTVANVEKWFRLTQAPSAAGKLRQIDADTFRFIGEAGAAVITTVRLVRYHAPIGGGCAGCGE